MLEEFKARIKRNYENAKRSVVISVFFTCFSLFFTVHYYFDISPIHELVIYEGFASDLIERNFRYSDHIEFTLNDKRFYYSGAYEHQLKNIIRSNDLIKILAEKDTKKTNEPLLIYSLDTKDKSIFSYQESVIEHKFKSSLLLLLSFFFVGFSYVCYKHYKKVLKPKL